MHFKTLILLFKSFHEFFWHNNTFSSAAIFFWNNPPPPTPRRVTVICVNVRNHKLTCTNVTPKKWRNGGHFRPHALSCAWVKIKMPVKCMSILLTEYSEPVLVLFLDYITHKAQLLGSYSQMSIKSVLCTEGKFSVFFRVYAISTFRLFIEVNSCSRYANVL